MFHWTVTTAVQSESFSESYFSEVSNFTLYLSRIHFSEIHLCIFISYTKSASIVFKKGGIVELLWFWNRELSSLLTTVKVDASLSLSVIFSLRWPRNFSLMLENFLWSIYTYLFKTKIKHRGVKKYLIMLTRLSISKKSNVLDVPFYYKDHI